MTQYIIANHPIEVSGRGLSLIPGFNSFASANHTDGQAILQLQQGVPLMGWDIAPLHRFPLGNGEVMCSFGIHGGVYLLRMEKAGKAPLLLRVMKAEDCFVAQTNMEAQKQGELLRFACWMAYGIAAVHHQTLAMHASTVSYAGKSILFLGESGTGKSTHTQLWLNHISPTELLNDDSPFVRVMEDHSVWVFGSPWSGKTPCYQNKSTAVAAIVRLSQAPYNKIKRLKGIAALGSLLPSCPPAFAYDPTLLSYISRILDIILQQVPIYSLECLPNPEAAQLVLETLQESGRL